MSTRAGHKSGRRGAAGIGDPVGMAEIADPVGGQLGTLAAEQAVERGGKPQHRRRHGESVGPAAERAAERRANSRWLQPPWASVVGLE